MPKNDQDQPAMPPPATLRVQTSPPLKGSVRLVGDKSISHRALLLGALADGETHVQGLSPCADVMRSLAAIETLGVVVERRTATELIVHGCGPAGLAPPPSPATDAEASPEPPVQIDCGDSGTTMRLLAGLLAGQGRPFVLDGSSGLCRRPMARVVEPLIAMGARVEAHEGGRPPLRGRPPLAASLIGRSHHLARASAQVGSAILLAGLRAEGNTEIHYPRPVRDHSERMLSAMGAPLRWDGRRTVLEGPVARLRPAGDSGQGPSGQAPSGGRLRIPADLSCGAFLLAAAALQPGSDVYLPELGLNPGRTGFLEILRGMGAGLEESGWTQLSGEPVGDLRLRRPAGHGNQTPGLRGIEVGGDLVPRAIDELPLLAVLACGAEGRTVLRDATELRVKECDRITAICEGLGRMGARIEARADGFVIDGPCPLEGAEVDGWGDHRIVMALAVAGLVAEGETRIRGAERVADSFPGFVEIIRALGGVVARENGHGSPTVGA